MREPTRLLVVALIVVGWMAAHVEMLPAQAPGSVSGLVVNASRAPLEGYGVQVRNLTTGQLVGRTTTDGDGQWSFDQLIPGSYVLEAVDEAGRLVAVSSDITLGTNEGLTGVILVVSDRRSPLARLFTSTAGIAALAAAGSGIVAGVVTNESNSVSGSS